MSDDILQKEIKAQPIRLIDIFVLAPFLLYAGTRKSKLSSPVKNFMIVSAISIFAYELKNYLEIKRRAS